MAHAVLSVPNFLGPLQTLWARAMQPQPAGTQRHGLRPAQGMPVPAPRWRRPAPAPAPAQPAVHALRVVRVVDAGQARGGAGRMVISGRMADVCAELERLADREAQQR